MTLDATASLFVIAGETSGDTLGAALLDALAQLAPDVRCMGVGGPNMRARNFTCLFPMEQLQTMGFTDTLRALPRLIPAFWTIEAAILRTRPDAVVFIDYPGLNLRLAQRLRRKGYKGRLIQYVCPSVWAWKRGRIATMARDLDLVLCLLPFEPPLFAGTDLQAEFVGHPLATRALPTQQNSQRTISLFPGSRLQEVRRNLPFLVSAAKQLHAETPHLEWAISVAQPHFVPLIQEQLRSFPCRLVSAEETEALIAQSHLALAKCGTIALQLALAQVPTVVIYAMNRLDQFLAKRVFRINLPYYSLPNLLQNQEIFPELIGPHLDLEQLVAKARPLLTSSPARDACLQGCRAVHQQLSLPEPAVRAALAILQVTALHCSPSSIEAVMVEYKKKTREDESPFVLHVDRLKQSEENLSIHLSAPTHFLQIDEEELEFSKEISIHGEAYTTEDHLILCLEASTSCSLPCSFCNNTFSYPIHVEPITLAIPFHEIHGPFYSYAEELRSAILLLVPAFAECNNGRCSQRPAEAQKKSIQPDTYLPFADL